MSVRRFTGRTSREAMRQVRDALGDDALILANRRTEQGVEILAMADTAMKEIADEPPAAGDPEPAPQARSLQNTSEQLLREMQDMRALLAREQARQAPGSDCRTRLRRLLLEAGFSGGLADELLGALPAEFRDSGTDDPAPLTWLQRRIAARLSTLEDEARFFDPPGIISLVGPTGVGKTTTSAKLAARFVERHGADQVALVTTDSFRIGAHEQLRIYAELLGIPVHALEAGRPVDSLAPDLRGRRWVIIDTVGMSQRDQRIIEQIAQLQEGRVRVRMVLLLNAASQPETLDEVASRYSQAAHAAGATLEDCLLTKQDEAVRMAPALEAVIRHGLNLSFVSHGQRVPEDLATGEATALVTEALATRSPLATGEAGSTRPAGDAPGNAPRGQLLGQGRRVSTVLDGLQARISGFADLTAAWDVSELPTELQSERLDTLYARQAGRGSRSGMLWSPRRPAKGVDWAMPDLGVDARGLWSAFPDLQHRQPAGEVNRLISARDQGAATQLFCMTPEATTREWLDARQIDWLCQARPGQRVIHQGERLSLSALAPLAHSSGQAMTRRRGQPCQVVLSRLDVTAFPPRPGQASSEQPVTAWFGTLVDPDDETILARRYWLTPVTDHDQALALVFAHLRGEGLEALTRQTLRQLDTLMPAQTRLELRLLVAAGIAATASHLEHDRDEAAMDLRAELLALGPGRRRRRDVGVLESIVALMGARDAIRQVGAIRRYAIAG